MPDENDEKQSLSSEVQQQIAGAVKQVVSIITSESIRRTANSGKNRLKQLSEKSVEKLEHKLAKKLGKSAALTCEDGVGETGKLIEGAIGKTKITDMVFMSSQAARLAAAGLGVAGLAAGAGAVYGVNEYFPQQQTTQTVTVTTPGPTTTFTQTQPVTTTQTQVVTTTRPFPGTTVTTPVLFTQTVPPYSMTVVITIPAAVVITIPPG